MMSLDFINQTLAVAHEQMRKTQEATAHFARQGVSMVEQAAEMQRNAAKSALELSLNASQSVLDYTFNQTQTVCEQSVSQLKRAQEGINQTFSTNPSELMTSWVKQSQQAIERMTQLSGEPFSKLFEGAIPQATAPFFEHVVQMWRSSHHQSDSNIYSDSTTEEVSAAREETSEDLIIEDIFEDAHNFDQVEVNLSEEAPVHGHHAVVDEEEA